MLVTTRVHPQADSGLYTPIFVELEELRKITEIIKLLVDECRCSLCTSVEGAILNGLSQLLEVELNEDSKSTAYWIMNRVRLSVPLGPTGYIDIQSQDAKGHGHLLSLFISETGVVAAIELELHPKDNVNLLDHQPLNFNWAAFNDRTSAFWPNIDIKICMYASEDEAHVFTWQVFAHMPGLESSGKLSVLRWENKSKLWVHCPMILAMT